MVNLFMGSITQSLRTPDLDGAVHLHVYVCCYCMRAI